MFREILVASATVATTVAVGGIISLQNDIKEEREYLAMAIPLCKKVMAKFDANNDGLLNSQEGAQMARSLGYDGTFPTEYAVINLVPDKQSRFNDYSVTYLELSSQGSNIIGLSHGRPVWNETIEVPVSRLYEILEQDN